MGRIIRNLVRHDSGADPDFARRIRAAAEEAERYLTGASTESEAARLRMLGRMGLIGGNSGADVARQRMIQRHQRREDSNRHRHPGPLRRSCGLLWGADAGRKWPIQANMRAERDILSHPAFFTPRTP